MMQTDHAKLPEDVRTAALVLFGFGIAFRLICLLRLVLEKYSQGGSYLYTIVYAIRHLLYVNTGIAYVDPDDAVHGMQTDLAKDSDAVQAAREANAVAIQIATASTKLGLGDLLGETIRPGLQGLHDLGTGLGLPGFGRSGKREAIIGRGTVGSDGGLVRSFNGIDPENARDRAISHDAVFVSSRDTSKYKRAVDDPVAQNANL